MNKQIALVGNPNSGKTSVFNALTGGRQKVGNWAGVTVDCKHGRLQAKGALAQSSLDDWDVVDLPGTYALSEPEPGALDEQIACRYLFNTPPTLLINVIDANNLERNLYLTTELLELGVPLIVVLNMMDVAKRRQIQIDPTRLSEQLGCPVVVMNAQKGVGLKALRASLADHLTQIATESDSASTLPLERLTPTRIQQDAATIKASNVNRLSSQPTQEKTPAIKSGRAIQFPSAVEAAILCLRQRFNLSRVTTIALLEGDCGARAQFGETRYQSHVSPLLKEIATAQGEEADIVIADRRYQHIHHCLQGCCRRGRSLQQSLTQVIDKVVLNRVLALPIFLLAMYSMFFFAINVGGAFQDFLDLGSQAIFVDGFAHVLQAWHVPPFLVAILAAGAGKGLNTTITFIPVLGGMFFFLAFLESSGYMARAAFVVDRLMQMIGLPGKAFVPLIVGFGCNVPAVMGARTLAHRRDRILTTMMSPFMSCGARLAIYAVFTAAFFQQGGHNVVFALYLIGILMAVVTGVVLRKTVLKGESAPLILELPPYHLPSGLTLLRQTWYRTKAFLWRAGRVILPVCVLIGALGALTTQGTIKHSNDHQESLLAIVGQAATPVFAPMGIQQDNWPATVGLVTGVLAKEVVVATLNTLYQEVGEVALGRQTKFSLSEQLLAAWRTVPRNLAALPASLLNPIAASAPNEKLDHGVYGVMYQRFGGGLAAFAYLLFVLLYVPCVSTTAVMARELSRSWAWFSVCWSTGIAYGVATTFYQVATFSEHPIVSVVWVLGIGAAVAFTGVGLRRVALTQFNAEGEPCY